MNLALEESLKETLGKNEKLLWAGSPKIGILLRPSDGYLIPFSIMWAGFSVFWESTVLMTNSPFFFKLWGIPFVLMGIYITLGRFFIDALKRKNTVYGVTGNRVIIISKWPNKEIKSLNIKTISDITFKEKADGTGTISLGPVDPRYARFSGMGAWPGVKTAPNLELIDDVKKVYEILIEQQRQA